MSRIVSRDGYAALNPPAHGTAWSLNDLRYLWLEWPKAGRDRRRRHEVCDVLGRRSAACIEVVRKLRQWETAQKLEAIQTQEQWRKVTAPELTVVPQTEELMPDGDPLVDFMQEIADTMLNTNELLHALKEKLLVDRDG